MKNRYLTNDVAQNKFKERFMPKDTQKKLIVSLAISFAAIIICTIFGICYSRYHQIPKSFRRK